MSSLPVDPTPADSRRLCCYIGSDEFGGMEASLATALRHLSSQFVVTVLGVSAEVVNTVASARPGTQTMVVPPVRGKMDVRAIAAHVRAVRTLRPDLVLCSLAQLYDAQYGMVASLLNRVPVLAVVHCVLPSTSRRQQLFFRRLARRVTAFGGVSQAVCRASEEALGLPSGKFTLLYNGVADSEVGLPASPIDGDGPVIGAVGRIVPEKGYDVLIRAMTDLPDCRLVLLGRGPEITALQALAEELKVDDRVQFSGWVEPPWTSEQHFDVLAAPSNVEAFGLVAAEAMLARIPVVASRIGGFEEVILDGETGILVPVGNPQALAAGIRRILSDGELRTRIVERGRSEVLRRFSPATMNAAYEEFLRVPQRSRRATLKSHRQPKGR